MSDTERVAKHVRILAGLSLALGVLYVLVLLLIRFVIGLAAFPKPPEAVVVWFSPFGFILLLMGSLAILALMAGIGLLGERRWARPAAFVLAIVNLFSFPFGTAFGIYGIWVLTRPGIGRVLGRGGGSKAT